MVGVNIANIANVPARSAYLCTSTNQSMTKPICHDMYDMDRRVYHGAIPTPISMLAVLAIHEQLSKMERSSLRTPNASFSWRDNPRPSIASDINAGTTYIMVIRDGNTKNVS